VFILEPQTLFVSGLTQTIARCGGDVVRVAESLEDLDVASVRADVAVLDLDYPPGGVLERLGVFRGVAPPNMNLVVLTGEHGPGWLYRCRNAGACAVISKAGTTTEIAAAFRRIFGGAMFYDPRVDTA
jgi:DNA-binding NarL/FixJ family response regulator